MKQHIVNISKYIVILLLAVAAACSDEIKAPGGAVVEEGLPATLSFEVDLLDRAQVSRAQVPENLVTSLWIGVFNETTGEIKGRFAVEDINDETPEEKWRSITIETTTGKTRVVGVANYVHRFALTENGDKIELKPLGEALAAVRTFAEFEALAVTFNERAEISTDQPLNAMLMAGHYSEQFKDNEKHPYIIPEESTFVITPGKFTAPGCIHLRRLISQNIFNIEFNTANIESFSVLEWQAHNLPNSSWLRERTDGQPNINSGEVYAIDGASTADSDVSNIVSTQGNKVSFNFWQIENRHRGLEPKETDLSGGNYYSYRDREFKTADGRNTGKYSSLVPSADSDDYNNKASFVRFVVEMNMKTDSDGKPLPDGLKSRVVKAEYVVHLGYCENKNDAREQARDFNCRRNSKYTYNIKVKNINSMMVEVNREGEPTPSLEGDITDSSENAVVLDCHYNVVNVYFSKEELNDFRFAIEAPGPELGRNVFITHDNVPAADDPLFRFYSWIEFRRTTGQNVVADYKPHGTEGTYYLNEMNGQEPGWYTAFINENAYERFDDNGAIYADDRYNWQWYCDRPARRMWLIVRSTTSSDGQTVYYKSKYTFSQKSIQTYYDKSQNIKALGVEHSNETLGVNLRNNWNNSGNLTRNGAGYAGTSGRYNLGQYLMGVKPSGTALDNWRDNTKPWSDILSINRLLSVNAVDNQGLKLDARTEHVPAYNFTGKSRRMTQDGGGTFSYNTTYDVDRSRNPNYAEMITACMNRNRDNDGDGKIDRNEIRWFVPAELQMLRVILGRQALTTPVMDYLAITDKIYDNNSVNSRFLVACANGRVLWAMEGLSISAWYPGWSPGVQAPWNIRCVRYMGSDIADFSADTAVDPPYTQDPDAPNIIRLNHLDSRAVRTEAYRESDNFMPPHVLNDQVYNRCFRTFEIHPDEVVVLNSTLPGLGNGKITLAEYFSKYNPCENLKDKKGKDGWRVPNQKELSILSTFTKADGKTYYYKAEGSGASYLLSNTFSYFDKSGNPLKSRSATVDQLQNRYNLKVVVGNGASTQGDDYTVPDARYGVRCVRDVP